MIIFLIIPSYTLMVARDNSFVQQEIKYPLKNGKPTTFGINYYILTNKFNFIKEFEKSVNDTFFIDLEIKGDNLEGYTDYEVGDMGYHYTYDNGSDEIIIDNRNLYVAYDINDLSKFRRLNLSISNLFVKAVIMHELGHSYFLQNIILGVYDSLEISKEYDFRIDSYRMFPNVEQAYGASFIEEGVCEYIIDKMNVQLQSTIKIPQEPNDFMDKSIEHSVKYGYSKQYVTKFLDTYGLKDGIRMIITNKPPSYEEILNSKKYYDRLK